MPPHALLRALYPLAPESHLEAMARRGPTLLARHGLAGRPLRLHHLLAQVGHESAGLLRLEENLHYSAPRLQAVWPARFPTPEAAAGVAGDPRALAERVYGGRLGNGPEGSGDGWRFRGRGYIQLTGRATYARVGRAAGLDLEAEPELATAPEHALAVTLGFWTWKGLNTLADRDDLVAVTGRVNGGSHGLADRRAWLDKVRRVLLPPGPALHDAGTVVAVQRALLELGYDACGAADGIMGPRTRAAVLRYRIEAGLGEGGIDDTVIDRLGVEPETATRTAERATGRVA